MNTYNSREKTNHKAGGQKGHDGTTLTKVEVEERIQSGKYYHRIKIVGNPTGKSYITKYVIDLEVSPVITEIRIYADQQGHYVIPKEYRSDLVYGENIKAMAVALYSEGVMSNDRITAFLNAVSDDSMSLSEGSVYHFCKDFSDKAQSSIAHLEE